MPIEQQNMLANHAVPLERGRPKGRHQVCLFGSVRSSVFPMVERNGLTSYASHVCLPTKRCRGLPIDRHRGGIMRQVARNRSTTASQTVAQIARYDAALQHWRGLCARQHHARSQRGGIGAESRLLPSPAMLPTNPATARIARRCQRHDSQRSAQRAIVHRASIAGALRRAHQRPRQRLDWCGGKLYAHG